MAVVLTQKLQTGAITNATLPKPTPLTDDTGLAQATQTDLEINPGFLVSVDVSPAVFNRTPVTVGSQDLTNLTTWAQAVVTTSANPAGEVDQASLPHAAPVADSPHFQFAGGDPTLLDGTISGGAIYLFSILRDLKLDTTPFANAVKHVNFKADTDTVISKTGERAVTFFPTLAYNNGHLYILRGADFTFFTPADAAVLVKGTVIPGDALSTPGATALHELMHVILHDNSAISGFDDNGDAMVAALETVYTDKVNLELTRAGSGSASYSQVVNYSLAMGNVLKLTGGGPCLTAIGLPAGAALTVNAPPNVGAGLTISVPVTLMKADGSGPQASEEIAASIRVDQNPSTTSVLTTDGSGGATLNVTSPANGTSIVVTFKVLGQDISKTISILSVLDHLLPANPTVNTGGTVKLSGVDATGNPIPNGQLLWSSSATGIATVAADGTVTCIAPGSTVITATQPATQKTASTTVTVALTTTVTFNNQVYSCGGTVQPVPHAITLSQVGSTFTIKSNTGAFTLTGTLNGTLQSGGTFSVTGPAPPSNSTISMNGTLNPGGTTGSGTSHEVLSNNCTIDAQFTMAK
ncbi:MAG: Ig-like domain-containing protein [Acidobacteriota bacterium]|nr:Ig-like domain-containing protein [Acidobacteriota bacterium]